MRKSKAQARRRGPRQPRSVWHSQSSCTVADQASRRDRRYFEQHPGAARHVRKRIPGEFGQEAKQGWRPEYGQHVLVEHVAPGVRKRQSLMLLRRRDYPGGIIPFEQFEAVCVIAGGKPLAIFDDEIDDEPNA